MPPKKPIQPPQKNNPGQIKKNVVVNKGGKTTTTEKGAIKKTPAINKGGKTTNTNAKEQPGKRGNSSKKTTTAKPSKQEMAAVVIQRCVRTFLARCRARHVREKKIAYDNEMDRLEKEAYVQLAKAEQAEQEREYRKKEAELRAKREHKKRIVRMLDASFEGDMDEIEKVISEVKKIDDEAGIDTDGHGETIRERHKLDIVECRDANENTPLSEASSGGAVNVLKFLISSGADPNSIGHFRRTPLYRAAFAGHSEACQVLLEEGADPRLTAEDNQTPLQVCSQQNVKDIFTKWDIQLTEAALDKLSQRDQQRNQQHRSMVEHVNLRQEGVIKECEDNYKITQKQLCKARQEYEKRVTEHDLAAAEGYEKPENTIQAIKDAETHLALVEIEVSKQQELLQQAKLKLREQKSEQNKEEGVADDFSGITINIRELDDVLMRDIGDKIKSSNRCPLLIDTSGQSSVFLRYRDTNYLNVLQRNNMQPNIIRKALLGAVRFGKYMILDTMDVDMFSIYNDAFDLVQTGLLASLLNRSFIEQRLYLQLIQPEDGDAYNKNNFSDDNADKFKLVVVTSNQFQDQELLDRCYVIRVVVSN